jgi:hypothetical protein
MKLGTLKVEHLRQARACSRQVKLFMKVFPRGFVPSAHNFIIAANSGLSLAWAVNRLTDSKTSDLIFDLVHFRRWKTLNTHKHENFNVSVAHIWWELIQKQVKDI